ncbi:mitochondrial fission process protein 1 [Willisornis vidua]|uniref:Mitochondrial fission process protein 1 n=1 Tax=Willisornis vidua TaxID=1566151 RepID=A0ABQ9DEN5_9PASS|nr:mitochondrial fission process protein 1 [Willisornis vidua]
MHTIAMGRKRGTVTFNSKGNNITGISKTWWDGMPYDWNALVDGYRLFRRDGQGRRGRGVALCITEGLDCMQLTAGSGTVESLCIRIKGKTNNMDYIMEVCYRPPNQDDDTIELFLEEFWDTCKSTALVLMGDFNLPEINQEYYTVGTMQVRRLVKNLDHNFMEQLLMEPEISPWSAAAQQSGSHEWRVVAYWPQ